MIKDCFGYKTKQSRMFLSFCLMQKQRAKFLLWIMILQTFVTPCIVYAQSGVIKQGSSINNEDLAILLISHEPLVFIGPRAKQILYECEGYDASSSLVALSVLENAVTKKISAHHNGVQGTDDLPVLKPLCVTITQYPTGRSVTRELCQCDDVIIAPLASYADFIFTFDCPDSETAVQVADHTNFDGLIGYEILGGSRIFNDSYVRVNADKNADLRITGSVTLLGQVTLPGVAANAISGSSIVIDSGGHLGVVPGGSSGTTTFSSDVFMAHGTTFFVDEIDPRSPTTTTSFSGSISLPSTTTANNGSLQINGAPFLHNFGIANTFVGSAAGNLKMTGSSNVAVGNSAMVANTTGGSNVAVGDSAMSANTTGFSNTAVGLISMGSNTSGVANAAVGAASLYNNTTGSDNAAFGYQALLSNTTGGENTAIGGGALVLNTTGNFNTALGYNAMPSYRIGSTGRHTVVGSSALQNLITGTANTALGYTAGPNLKIGSNNLYIGSLLGPSIESSVIRLGTTVTHTACYVAGVNGVTLPGGGGTAVLIDVNGQLGTVVSASRYKEDIQDMGASSNDLAKLRPVKFRYKQDPTKVEYGLIAEEVQAVYPDLVVCNNEGQPETVRYHILPTMLLNEYQQLRKLYQTQDAKLKEISNELQKFMDKQKQKEKQAKNAIIN